MEKRNKYTELLGCRSSEEVYYYARKWTSNTNDNEHLTRSTILDMDARLEFWIKKILYNKLVDLVCHTSDLQKNDKNDENLWKIIKKMNFSSAFNLLKPCFDVYPSKDLSYIKAIHELRNQVTHDNDFDKVIYKGGNIFKDSETFARLFFEFFCMRKGLEDFYDRMIQDKNDQIKIYAECYLEKHGYKNYHPSDSSPAARNDKTIKPSKKHKSLLFCHPESRGAGEGSLRQYSEG